MTFHNLVTAAVVALGTAGAAQAASVGTGYSLGDNGEVLVTIGNIADPSNVTSTSLRDGMGNAVSLSELTVRPLTGQLYGYSDTNDTVYLVNPRTGLATAQVTSTDLTLVDAVGFDFNPMVDRARIVTTTNANIVFTPADSPNVSATPNTVARFTDLFYRAGDVNAGRDPAIFANAYTNSLAGVLPSGIPQTTQYVLDYRRDTLVTLMNNAGTLDTVGTFTLNGAAFNFEETGGFDILSAAGGVNIGYAILDSRNGQRLYSFDPAQRGQIALTDLGVVANQTGPLRGLAIGPSVVPLPAGGVLLLGALAGLGAIARRRKTV